MVSTDDAVVVDDVVEEVETEAEAEVVDEATAEVDEVEANEPSDSSPEKQEGKAEEKDNFQKRVDELTAIRRQEERQRIQAEQRAAELEQQLQALKPKAEPGKTLADFDYDEGKFSDYLVEIATQKAQESAQQRIAQEKAQARMAEFSVRETDFAKENSDYHAVTRNPTLNISQEMVNIAQGSENGPALLYHVAQHPDIADRLAALSPVDAAREMGRLEAIITAPKPKPVTTTPDPAPKLKATEKATTISASSAASDKLTTEEWLKRRNKELAKKAS